MVKNYEKEQKSRIQRKINSIWAAKILEIDGNHLVVRRSLRDDKKASIPVSDPEQYKVGQYIDVIIWSTGSSSYGAKYIGITPDEFIPEDGADIGF